MRLLIATFPEDVHALEVALVLREDGHEVALWHGSDFPTLQAGSVDFEDGTARWRIAGPELDMGDADFDVVWFRRSSPPVLPAAMHPGDRPVAQRECEDFVAGLLPLVSPEAFWVNPLESRARADLKILQLRAAQRAGLSIPRTLTSNDPRRIRAFLAEAGGPVVYKAFYPAQWRDGERVAHLLTSEVSLEALPADEVLRLTPGIFQPRIEKAHELRVTVMGERLVTARIVSQAEAATRLDWRARTVGLQVLPDELPAAVERQVLDFMRRMGLVFGCLDFIVTPAGDHVFLEVNPMGQFLWVEHSNPDVRLLGPFCDFLLGRGRVARERFRSVRHGDWFAPARSLGHSSTEHHVRWEGAFTSSDSSSPLPGRSGAEVPKGVSP